MIKKILLFIILVMGLLIFSGIHNNNPITITKRLAKQGNLNPGALKYRVYLFGIFPAGTAVFEKDKIEDYSGQKVYHLRATTNSLRLFSRFFHAYAAIDSYVDMQSLNPVLFRQRFTMKGRPDIHKEAQYDQKNGVMSIAGVKRQILPNTQDPLSTIFNLRRMNFDNIKELKMSLNTNQKNYVLQAKTAEKDLLISKESYKMVFVSAQIYRPDKNLYHKSNISMVLLKEKGNIPVLIKAFAGGVLISARLTDTQ